MQNRTKLILMNCAVAAALIYRWKTGTPIIPLAITAVIMFTLVNALLIFTAKRSPYQLMRRTLQLAATALPLTAAAPSRAQIRPHADKPAVENPGHGSGNTQTSS